MKTLKQKVQEYALKRSNDTTTEPTIRVCNAVVLNDVIRIVEAHDEINLSDLVFENEQNLFYRKLYARFGIALLGVIVILVLWIQQQ